FTNTNKDYLEEVRKIVQIQFDYDAKWYAKGKGFDLVFNDEVRQFFRELGIYGQIAENKTIPKEILQGTKEEISLFLNRLWSGDGWISVGKNNCEVGIGVQSYRMAKEIVFLLNKFGIGARIEEQKGG